MQAIIVQSFVAAPAAAVWDAFHQRTDVLFDGLPAKAWPALIEEQPPFHMKTGWPVPGTDVTVTLHELGGGVRVDVRHAGWADDDHETIQGHFAGWLQGLASLGNLLETAIDARSKVGGERYFVSGEIPAGAAAVYRSLTDEGVRARWSNGAFDGAVVAQEAEGKFIRWTRGGGEITAILRPTPRGTHLAIAEYGVSGREASARWPAMFEGLARFLS